MNDGHTDSPPSAHRWRFFRAGGFDQVRLDTAEDLFALDRLDPKLWVALSCPVANNEFPAATLRLLDTDGDGHIRSAELVAAAHWCRERLADPAILMRGGERLPLSAISAASEAGQRLRRSAEQILRNLGRPDATAIELADLADPAAIFGQTRFNGDGIVTALSTDDETLREAIARIGEARGTLTDRSGEPGIDGAAVDAFFAEAAAFLDWQGKRPPVADSIDPLAVAGAFDAVRAKIDDYFTRCRLAAYDERATGFMNGSDGELDAVGRQPLASAPELLTALPIARVAAGRALPLDGGINPAWTEAVAAFHQAAVVPLLGAVAQLDEAAWQTLKGRYAALAEWFAARPACPPAPDPTTLADWLANGVDGRLRELIAQDLALSEEAAGIDEVGKLLHFVRDLANFANNFVSFRDFYTRQGKAIFQAGTLYLDGRSCELTIGVGDIGQHGSLAALGKLYLVYCTCRRAGATRNIVAAMTDGDADQLMVGRNGVFVDRDGVDWDAQIVRLVDHPISLRQAFWAPYRRIGRMVGEQIQKFAANRAAAAEQKAAAAMIDTATKKPAAAGAAPAAPPFDVAKFAGIFAAIGLAIGALGTAAASVITGFIALKWWQMPLAIAGIMLLISGPSLVIAWFKLRSRTLGPLLDANGWAVNARARINLPFGRTLTALAELPPDAERALTDPYADKKTPWGRYAIIAFLVVAALWYIGRQSGH